MGDNVMLKVALKSFVKKAIEFIVEDKIAESLAIEFYNYITDYQRLLLEAMYNLAKRGVKPTRLQVIEEMNRLIEARKMKLKKVNQRMLNGIKGGLTKNARRVKLKPPIIVKNGYYILRREWFKALTKILEENHATAYPQEVKAY